MTKIETIREEIITLIAANLPDYTRIPNPYDPTDNTYLLLRKAYGVAIGPGRDTRRFIDCHVTWERIFTIILVNQIMTTDNNVDLRSAHEIELLNYHDVLRKKIWLNSTLNQNAIQATITDDQGISFLDAGTQKFFGLEMTLLVEYLENANS